MAVLSTGRKTLPLYRRWRIFRGQREGDICRLDGIKRSEANFCGAHPECSICTELHFFIKGGTLSSQSFEPERLTLIGEPVQVFQREVAAASVFFPSGFSISNTGLLAFQSSNDLATRMTWMIPSCEALRKAQCRKSARWV